MAVAGIQSVIVHNSSILGDSRTLESGLHVNQGRAGTRASSVLQMWRDLEDENVVSGSHGRARSRLLRHNSNGSSTHTGGSTMCQSRESDGRDDFEDSSESENGDASASDAQTGPQSELEDHRSITSEQSTDLGEIERDRVRKIFREWMNNGVTGHRTNKTSGNSSPRAQWLGERELERVRVVREWIQMTAQQGDAMGGNKEEQVGEIGVHIERVRDGLILDRNQSQIDSPRKGILRLCGRQALIDLLAKRVQDVQRELKGLVECRAVSSFPFRNRIQSLLRVRFLLNKQPIDDDRPNSAAESELGLLRQRSTVSNLREGFLSKLGDNVRVRASGHLDSSSDCCSDGFKDEEIQDGCSTEAGEDSNEQSGSVKCEGNTGTLLCGTVALAGSTSEERNRQGPVAIQVGTRVEHAFDNGVIALALSTDSSHESVDTGGVSFRDGVHSTEVHMDRIENSVFVNHLMRSVSTSLVYTVDLAVSVSEERNFLGSVDLQAETGLEHAFDGGERNDVESADEENTLPGYANMQEVVGLEHSFRSGEGNQIMSNFDEFVASDDEGQWQMVNPPGFEDGENSQLEGANEVLPEHCDIDSEEHSARFMLYHSGSFQGSVSEQERGQDTPTLVEDQQEQVTGGGESIISDGIVLSNVWGNVVLEETDWHVEDWQGQVTEDVERDSEGSVLSDRRNVSREEVDGRNLAGSDNEMLHENTGDGVENHVAASSWHLNGSTVETIRDTQEMTSVVRDEASYYSDDDGNTHHTELRELLSRRRVSSLLHSGFRESLNRLVQSYVERQTQSVNAWDLQEMPFPPDTQDQGPLRIDQNEEPTIVNAFSSTQQLSTTGGPRHRQWDQVLHHSSWSRHDTRHCAGTELETINDLRIDMARLQQRLSTMQRMLEACMDMQIELQRSVRQEVSAALNRSTDSTGPFLDPLLKDGSNWDYVRKGVCCLCCKGKVDSLLYRCGHMCTCTECAYALVECSRRCPMCQAPVLEVIRAYTVQ